MDLFFSVGDQGIVHWLTAWSTALRVQSPENVQSVVLRFPRQPVGLVFCLDWQPRQSTMQLSPQLCVIWSRKCSRSLKEGEWIAQEMHPSVALYAYKLVVCSKIHYD